MSLDQVLFTWWAVYTFDEYKRQIAWQKRERYERVEKLDILQEHLKARWESITDPVQYLHMIYFGGFDSPRMSIETLWEKTKNIWLSFKTYDWLHKMIQAFWWELYSPWEKTETWWRNSANNHHNVSIADSNIESFKLDLISVLDISDIWPRHITFDINEFNNCKFPIDKALYLIGLNNDSFWELLSISDLWKKALTSCVNKLCREAWKRIYDELWINIEIPELKDWSIWNLIRKLRK